MTTNSDLYTSRLPDGLLLITVENVRDEMKRIGAMRSALSDHALPQGYYFDAQSADNAERDLMVLVLKAAAFGHPNIRSLAFAVVENEI